MRMPPEFVIFDCDGVLVDSEPITNEVIRQSLANHGLVLSLDEVMQCFVGGTMQGVMTKARDMGAKLQEDWLTQINDEMFEALRDKCQQIEGVDAVLDALDDAGILYAVGSNGPHAKMNITLKRSGLFHRLQGRIFSREDVEHPKPAPDVYLAAARTLGIDPGRCVVIEDSASGAQAGKAAGMVTFGFAADTPAETLAETCSAVFKDMRDLPALLGLEQTAAT